MSITNINSIPADVIKGHIFPCLESKDLPAVARVCKLWNQHASSDTVWKPLFQKAFPGYDIITPIPSIKKWNLLDESDPVWAPFFPKAFPDYTITPIPSVKEQYRELELAEIAKIEKAYPAVFLDIFGGAKEFRKLPALDNHGIFVQETDLTASVMRGEYGSPFIAIKMKGRQTDSNGLFCVYAPYINDPTFWTFKEMIPGKFTSFANESTTIDQLAALISSHLHDEYVKMIEG